MTKLYLLIIAFLSINFCLAQENDFEELIQSNKYIEVDLFPDSLKPFFNITRLPMYPDGIDGFYKDIADNLRYPKKAFEEKIDGIVLISFVIQKDGTINEFELIEKINPILDEEVIRLFSSNVFDTWIPAKINDEVVKIRYTIPIEFSLDY